jgi:hypothetical protein
MQPAQPVLNKCPICTEPMTPEESTRGKLVACVAAGTHYHHRDCVTMIENNKCPICRGQMFASSAASELTSPIVTHHNVTVVAAHAGFHGAHAVTGATMTCDDLFVHLSAGHGGPLGQGVYDFYAQDGTLLAHDGTLTSSSTTTGSYTFNGANLGPR